MNASLRALLSGVVDYAGLFPPASLDLDNAFRNYACYRQGPDAWMLGRFVIPAARLSELDAFADVLQEGPPFALCMLGDGRRDLVRFVNAIGADCESARNVSDRLAGRVRADVCEIRLPADCTFRTVALIADMLGPAKWALFFEDPLAGNQEEPLLAMLSKVAQIKAKGESAYLIASAGLKLRTGGLEASAFPSVEQVAFVLHACRDAGVPMKFTAGLHHPIRRYDAGVQTHMHGFINVFTAGVLAHARRLGEDHLRAVLADEDPASFVFTDDGLRWRDFAASTAEIALARTDFVTSFGSCSFDEPRDDLRALGWL